MHSPNPSSFQSSEFDIHLPCDDALWDAAGPSEWFEALYTPSPYGSGSARLVGVDMGSALASIGQMCMSTIPVSQNPFANFLLVHSLLNSTSEDPVGPTKSQISPIAGSSRWQDSDKAIPAHYALYNWLQAWLNCPVHAPYIKCPNGTHFILNALPFHWLLQVSLLARHAGGLVPLSGYLALDGTELLLLSCWLDQVRVLLARAEPISPQLWDELTKIRIHISQLDTAHESIDLDGLLAFLPHDH